MLSEYTGLSTATISRYINQSGYVSEEAGKRLEKAFQLLGYEPKKKKTGKWMKKGSVIGVMIPEYNTFFTEMIRGIQDEAQIRGYQTVVCSAQRNAQNEIKNLNLLKMFASGLVIAPLGRLDHYYAEMVSELDRNYFPIVMADGEIIGAGMDGVFVDGQYGAYIGVKALIENGHRHIALLAGNMASKTGIDRFNGYVKALRENGIELDEQRVFYADFDGQKAYELMKNKLQHSGNITAVFSSNYLMTLGCIRAMEELSIEIPKDMGLVSFDDDPSFSIGKLQISAVVNPGYQVGTESAQRLCDRIQKGERRSKIQAQCRIHLRPRLILRGSEYRRSV